MIEYSDKSDFEINKLIIDIIFSGFKVHVNINRDGTPWCIDLIHENEMLSRFAMDYPDYCNNPSDSWRLMVDSGINLNKINGLYEAAYPVPLEKSISESPGRAVSICFLMIKST